MLRLFVDRVQLGENIRLAAKGGDYDDDRFVQRKWFKPIIIVEEEDGPYWDEEPDEPERVMGFIIRDKEGNEVASMRYHNRRPGGYVHVWVDVNEEFTEVERVYDYWPDERGDLGHS